MLRTLKSQLTSWTRRLRPATHVEAGSECPASWYDEQYSSAAADAYSQHYTCSRYYFLWTVIADRLGHTSPVLEIGCGSGQFAQLLHDWNPFVQYFGFDFSPVAIGMAKRRCPNLRFDVADAFVTNAFQEEYDAVVCTEVLEHIEQDLAIIERIRKGTRVIATVPSFPYISHVRHFTCELDVQLRYEHVFDSLKVTRLFADQGGRCFYLLDGRVR